MDKHKEKKKSQYLFETIENDDLFYYLHKNKIKKYNNLNNNDDNNNENDTNNKDINSENSFINNTEREQRKKPNKMSLNIKEIKNINHYFNDKCITNREINREKISRFELNYGEKKEINSEKEKNSSQDSKNNDIKINNPINEFNNNTHQNKNTENKNFLCLLCKNNIITNYCTKCNNFICNNCLENCKKDNHEYMEIKNEDCLSNINFYGLLIISHIDKKVKQFEKYGNELKTYDIKKKRDNIISIFNDIINLYSQIIQILKKIYSEKDVKNAMTKYKLDSDNIKGEINNIIKKAESYIKSDSNNNKSNFKIKNMQYFFGLINEKQNNHQLITEKMTVYALNSNINSNLDNNIKEIEEKIKRIANKENSFDLKNNLKEEYEKLIKDNKNNNVTKEKKNFYRRKSVALNIQNIHLPNLPSILIPDLNNNKSNE